MFRKILSCLICIIFSLMLLTSCGKSSEISEAENASSENNTVWRGKRSYIENAGDEYDDFIYRDGKFYFMSYEYPENGAYKTSICCSGIDGAPKKIITSDGNNYIDSFAIDNDGNIIFAETSVIDEKSRKLFLKRSAPDGTEISSFDITEYLENISDHFYNISDIAVDGNGNIYLANYMLISAFSSDGKFIFGKNTDNEYISKLIVSAGGDVYAQIYSDGYYIKKTDPQSGEFGEEIHLSDNGQDYETVPYNGFENDDIYFDDGTSLCAFDIETKTKTEILNWVDSDIIHSEISALFREKDSSNFICAGKSYPDGELIFTEISPHSVSEFSERMEIIIAGREYAVTDSLEYQAIKFNTENDDFRVKIKKYTDPNGLSTDIISGKIPDILLIDNSMNINGFAEKGIFCDLYEFIDNDSEISREDLLPNILEAFENDGKLFYFTDDFQICTVLGKKSIFGDKKINFSELEKIKENFPDGTEIFSGESKTAVLQDGLQMSPDNFINYKTGECYFDSDEFTALLEFADSFPDSSELNFNEAFWQDLDTMYADESALLMSVILSCYGDFYCYEHGYFGEETSAVGFPSMSGDAGSAIFLNSGFAISAKSDNSDGAWQFARTLLLPEYQDQTEDFPVRISSLENKARREMNMSGNDSYSSVITMGDYALSSTKFVSDIGKPSQADIDRIDLLVKSVSRLVRYDDTVRNIVSEEAGAFFAGDRTSKEAAEMIQNRVSTYLAENR